MRRIDILRTAAVASLAIGMLAGCTKAASTGAQNGSGSNSWTQPGVFRFAVRKGIYDYNTDLKGFKPSPVISPFWNPWEYSI